MNQSAASSAQEFHKHSTTGQAGGEIGAVGSESDWRLGISPIRISAALLRRARAVVLIPMVVTILAVVRVFALPPYFEATARFIPEASGPPNDLGGLAAMAGLSINTGSGGESPQFYADLLRRRPIQYRVLKADYSSVLAEAAVGRRSALLSDLRAEGSTNEERLINGVEALANRTAVSVDRQTGIVAVTMTAGSPSLAAAVANRYVHELIEFNRNSRQTRARARREFVQARMYEAQVALNTAEDDILRFRQRNKQFDSPALQAEHERLQRTVALRQEQFVSLAGQLNSARLAEVDDTPRLTVIEPAEPPISRSGPRRKQTIVLVALGSLAATIVGVLLYEFGRTPMLAHLRKALIQAHTP